MWWYQYSFSLVIIEMNAMHKLAVTPELLVSRSVLKEKLDKCACDWRRWDNIWLYQPVPTECTHRFCLSPKVGYSLIILLCQKPKRCNNPLKLLILRATHIHIHIKPNINILDKFSKYPRNHHNDYSSAGVKCATPGAMGGGFSLISSSAFFFLILSSWAAKVKCWMAAGIISTGSFSAAVAFNLACSSS